MADLEERVNRNENKIDVLTQQVQDFIAESRAARAKQAEEMKEYRANINAMNQRMDAMNQRIDAAISSIHSLTTAAFVGVGASVLGMAAIAASVVYFVLNK